MYAFGWYLIELKIDLSPPRLVSPMGSIEISWRVSLPQKVEGPFYYLTLCTNLRFTLIPLSSVMIILLKLFVVFLFVSSKTLQVSWVLIVTLIPEGTSSATVSLKNNVTLISAQISLLWFFTSQNCSFNKVNYNLNHNNWYRNRNLVKSIPVSHICWFLRPRSINKVEWRFILFMEIWKDWISNTKLWLIFVYEKKKKKNFVIVRLYI